MTRFPTLLTLFLLACAGESAPAPTPAPAPVAPPAPTEPAKPAEPAKPDDPTGPADLAHGAEIYGQYCKACHQEDGTGMNGMLAANFNEKGRLDKTDDQLKISIRDGFQGKSAVMPPWGGTLSAQDRTDVLAHIRATYGEASK